MARNKTIVTDRQIEVLLEGIPEPVLSRDLTGGVLSAISAEKARKRVFRWSSLAAAAVLILAALGWLFHDTGPSPAPPVAQTPLRQPVDVLLIRNLDMVEDMELLDTLDLHATLVEAEDKSSERM